MVFTNFTNIVLNFVFTGLISISGSAGPNGASGTAFAISGPNVTTTTTASQTYSYSNPNGSYSTVTVSATSGPGYASSSVSASSYHP